MPRVFEYEISTVRGRIRVEGERVGRRQALAVRSVELGVLEQYVVDHIPTGRRIVELEDRREAIRFARELDRIVGRTLIGDDHVQVRDAIPELVQDWIGRVEREGRYVPFALSEGADAGA